MESGNILFCLFYNFNEFSVNLFHCRVNFGFGNLYDIIRCTVEFFTVFNKGFIPVCTDIFDNL